MTSTVSKITEAKFPTTEFLLGIEDYEYHHLPTVDNIQQFLFQKKSLRNSQKVTFHCLGGSYHVFLDATKKGPTSLKPTVNDIYNSNCPEFTWVIRKYKGNYLISNNYFNQYLASINGQAKMIAASNINSSNVLPNHLLWNFKKHTNPTYQIQNKSNGLFLFASTKNSRVATSKNPSSWYIKVQK